MSFFATEHHEDNKKVKQKFNNVIESIYQEISCNPFQMASLSTINNSNPFPQSVSDQLKQVLSTGERQFKAFIQDRLLMQRTAITEKISKNKFFLWSIRSSKSTSINLRVPFMNKVRSAVELMNYLEKKFGEYNIVLSLTEQMKCIMAAWVEWEKDYHHVSNQSCQRLAETP